MKSFTVHDDKLLLLVLLNVGSQKWYRQCWEKRWCRGVGSFAVVSGLLDGRSWSLAGGRREGCDGGMAVVVGWLM